VSQRLKAPVVHPDLAAFVALAVTDEQRTAALVEVRFGQRERLLDPQPGTPQHHDQAACAIPVPGHLPGASRQ
jgi:hypothetical protein